MTLREPALRLFYAALPDAPTRARMAEMAEALQRTSTVRTVPAANYHVTLAFLGSIPLSRVPTLEEIGAAQRGEAGTLCFDRFEYWAQSTALVASASVVPDRFERLWRSLHRALAERGCALDTAPVRPHVTLARNISQAPVLPAMSPVEWTLNEFSLMCSDTSGTRSAYTVVGTWPLLYTGANT